nr:MAG TPA: hypothetical protein [Caudoviricetes sp.]
MNLLQKEKKIKMKQCIYIDDINLELDATLVKLPYKYRELFIGCHFKNMEELNAELRSAAYCNINTHCFGATPIDRKRFLERMESRKRDGLTAQKENEYEKL